MTPGPEYSEEDVALAGEYVLGLLSPDQVQAFEARLPHDADLRALVHEWDEHLAALADEVADVAPPARVKRRIDRILFAEANPRRLPRWLGALGGLAVAAVLALVLFSFVVTGPGDVPPAYIAELESTDGTLRLAAAVHAPTHTLEISHLAGAALPGRVLELWLIPSDTGTPVSLGLLTADGTTIVDLGPEIRASIPGGTLAISDEPPGGSPTGQPTGAVLAAGDLTPT